ncbi:hypothetical protein EDD11_005995 [Mortierella claussenii]|nr:hypothetical protein EDD11_005995 [Mortierella claussenii]
MKRSFCRYDSILKSNGITTNRTGSKCLPQGKQSPRGDLVNDCHAEVLARRGFNRWCLHEMQSSISNPSNATNKFRYTTHLDSTGAKERPHFELANPQTQFHLYISQAPCGDATTASLAQVQTEESRNAFLSGQQAQKTLGIDLDSIQEGHQVVGSKRQRISVDRDYIEYSPLCKQQKVDCRDNTTDNILRNSCSHVLGFRRGRTDYGSVGVLRTKPGRVDSEPTMSMSCSDKIARWNVLGLTSALVAPLLLRTIYLHSVITGELHDATALRRALYDRVRNCDCIVNASLYQPSQIEIHKSPVAFEFSKEVMTLKSVQDGVISLPVACSTSISWIISEPSKAEVLINGCKAGASTKQPLQPKSRSRLCKINMYQQSVALWKSLTQAMETEYPHQALVQRMNGTDFSKITYGEWKNLDMGYVSAKKLLLQGVFRNWLRGDKNLEMFNVEGCTEMNFSN